MNTLTAPGTSNWLNKVPEVVLSFWVIKIMSTTVGETGADFLAVNAGWGQGVTRAVMGALLAAALLTQLRTRRYTPWIYWLTVVLVSVVGTQITDLILHPIKSTARRRCPGCYRPLIHFKGRFDERA
jgi:uncharacterized membrane-anchored protein